MRLLLEGIVLTVVAIIAAALSLRAIQLGGVDIPAFGHTGPGTLVPLLVVTIVLGAGLWFRFRRQIHAFRPTPFLLLGLLLVVVVPPAVKLIRQVRFHLREEDGAERIRSRPMTEQESHAFGLRLVGTIVTDSARTGRTVSSVHQLTVDPSWPVPEDLEFTIDRAGDDLWIYSRRRGTVCRVLLSTAWRRMGQDYHFGCVPPGYEPQSGWATLERAESSTTVSATPPSDAAAPWPQYRRDPWRSGTVQTQEIGGLSWHADAGGQIRASTSVIGSLVFAGAHGNGVLAAYDLHTGTMRWMVREPNWIHQDPIGDGQAVFVGFGGNRRSFQGADPAGLAAHDTQTGRRLWTRFTSNSVMTSPVLHGSLVLVGTAAGQVLALHRSTGDTAWQTPLPGNIMMAPPLLSGDTLIVTLDPRSVCALNASQGNVYFCQRLPRLLGGVGHISPAMGAGRILGSAVVHFADPGQMLFASGIRAVPALWRWLTTGVLPSPYQVVFALSPTTGELEWQTPLDGGACCTGTAQSGHMSGTPVVVPADSSLVVVSPYADRVYRLDEETGAILARSEPIPVFPRGPALVVDSTVIAVDRQGVIHVLAVDDLHERCAVPLGEPVDRAGPTLAAGSLIIAGRDGGLYAIPAAPVLTCDPGLAGLIARLKEGIGPQ